MSTLPVRRTNPASLPARTEWSLDPFETMRELMRWEPFGELARPSFAATFNPAFEVKETKEGFLFKADVPGMKESDIEVNLTGNRLNISGKREAEKREEGATYYNYERSYGSFLRTFTVPDGTDAEHVRAELKEGVLTVNLPKLPAAQPKRIAISSEKVKA